MSKYQERMVSVSLVALIFFLVLSMFTSNWGFLLFSLPPIFINLMFAFFAKNNKYIQGFNQKHAEKLNPQ